MKVKATGDPFEEVLAWLREVQVTIPDPEPVAFRWTRDGMDEIPVADATDDDLVIHPDRPELEDLAHSVLSIVKDCTEMFPGRRSWRRWTLTRKVASLLYVSGLTSSGGSLAMGGRDPIGGWVVTMPSLDRHPRPYRLWLPDWWWQCQRRQGWQLRGRHRPAHPWVMVVCARCAPCTYCGELYDCLPACETMATA